MSKDLEKDQESSKYVKDVAESGEDDKKSTSTTEPKDPDTEQNVPEGGESSEATVDPKESKNDQSSEQKIDTGEPSADESTSAVKPEDTATPQEGTKDDESCEVTVTPQKAKREDLSSEPETDDSKSTAAEPTSTVKPEDDESSQVMVNPKESKEDLSSEQETDVSESTAAESTSELKREETVAQQNIAEPNVNIVSASESPESPLPKPLLEFTDTIGKILTPDFQLPKERNMPEVPELSAETVSVEDNPRQAASTESPTAENIQPTKQLSDTRREFRLRVMNSIKNHRDIEHSLFTDPDVSNLPIDGLYTPAEHDHPKFQIFTEEVLYRISLDVSLFEGEDVHVGVKDDKIDVYAMRKIENKFGSVNRELHQVFSIPQNVDKDRLKGFIPPDGRLRIEAPFKGKSENESQDPC